MSLTPKQTHSFLSTCLGLETWTKKQARAQEDLKKTEAEKTSLSVQLSQKQALLDYAKNNLQSVSIPEDNSEEIEHNIRVIKTGLEQQKKRLETLENDKNKELSEIPYPSLSQVVGRPTKLTDIEKEIGTIKRSIDLAKNEKQKNTIDCLNKIKNIESAIAKSENDIQALQSVQIQLNTLKEEIVKLRENVCPTCTQTWENGHQNTRLNLAIEEYKKLMQKEDALKKSIDDSRALPKQLDAEKDRLSKIDSDNSILELTERLGALEEEKNTLSDEHALEINGLQEKNMALLSEHKAKTESVLKKYSESTSSLSFDINNKNLLVTKLSSDLDSLKKAISVAKDQKHRAEKEISLFETEVQNLKSEIIKNELVFDKVAISGKAIESYINFLFQNSLAQIASRANEILSKVSNTATTTISFDSYKETKSGSVKEEVSILVHMDDELKVPLKSLSGGEETAIELAVDMAVIEMIESRAGIGFDTYILDEPFDGLDSVCKANCLEVLSNSNAGKKIIIVDHSEETKEMIASKITVVRDGQISKIEVAK